MPGLVILSLGYWITDMLLIDGNASCLIFDNLCFGAEIAVERTRFGPCEWVCSRYGFNIARLDDAVGLRSTISE